MTRRWLSPEPEMARLLIEERYTWPVRAVLLGGGGLRATSYQILIFRTPKIMFKRVGYATDSMSYSPPAR
jgi:hypothetical protein